MPEAADQADHVDQFRVGSGAAPTYGKDGINAAAAAAYRASVEVGKPLSERKLAAMFGRTSRRWARNRIAETRQASAKI